MALNSTTAKFVACFVILCALPIIYFAVCWGMADIKAYPVRYALERWENKGEVDPEELTAMAAAIESALSWQPHNPEYIELQARIKLHQAIMIEEGIAFKKAVREILALHNIAIELRPQWPYSWANKALMKAYLEEFDTEYLEAMQQSEHFGPWELSVNLTVLQAGLIGWFSLTPDDKLVVVRAADRATEHNWRSARNLLDLYQRRYSVCAFMQRTEMQKKACY